MKIREIQGGKKYPYGLDYYIKRKRYRPTFQTKIERERFKKELIKKVKNNRSLLVNFDQDFYLKCLDLREKMPDGYDFEEIFYKGLENLLSVSSITIREACNQLLEEVKIKRTRDYGHDFLYLNLFCDFVGGNAPVTSISVSQVQNWINTVKKTRNIKSGVTLDNYKKSVSKVFMREVKLGRLDKSPATHVVVPPTPKKEPVIMPVIDVIRFLQTALKMDASMAGLHGLLFLSGLRKSVVAPEEQKQREDGQLSPEMIQKNARMIVIPPQVMKTRKQHIMSEERGLPSTIWDWIDLIDPNDYKLYKRSYQSRFDKIREASGVTVPPNSIRRSFGTYMSLIHNSQEIASQMMAQVSKKVFISNYEGVSHSQGFATQAEAEVYFSLTPKNLDENLKKIKKVYENPKK